MRTPTAKGLRAMAAPVSRTIWKVSPGGVPAGQHDAIGREDLLRARALVDKANGGDARLVIFAAGPLRSIGDARFGNALARKHQPIKARKEPHLSPGLLDGPTQVAHDVDEQVGADMGLGVHEDVRRRAGPPRRSPAHGGYGAI